MSKNHPHDNIYSILGKLDALKPTPEEKRFALVKEIRESVEAQGSILSGVDAVQDKLAKQFAESKIEEKAVSKAQQKFMGMVHSAQKGEKAASPAVAKVAKSMGKKDAEDFASTKHKGLPAHVEESEVCAECGMAEGTCQHSMKEEQDPNLAKAYHMGNEAYKAYKHDPKLAQAAQDKFDDMEIVKNHPEYAKMWVTGYRDGERFDKQASMKEGEIKKIPGGVRHTKTDYPGYPTDDTLDNIDNLKGPGGGVRRGRPLKAQTKNPRRDPNAEKRGRGRPAAVKSGPVSMPADPFGRTTGRVPKGHKGTVHTVDEAMGIVARNLMVMEGMNFKRMMEEQHMTLDEMVECMNADMQVFKETGVCSDRLRDMMEVYAHAKRQADEGIEQPQQGGIGDVMTPQDKADKMARLTPNKPGVMGSLKSMGQGLKAFAQGKPEPIDEEQLALEAELNELAKLAGLTKEGNAFTGKLKDTAKGDKFDLDGKEYTDTSTLDEEPNEGNAFGKAVRDAKADGVQPGEKVEVGGKTYPVKESRMGEIDALYQDWVNSEYAPFDSDSGDWNAVVEKAMRFLNGRVSSDQIESVADLLANHWHGGQGVMGEEEELANAPAEKYDTIDATMRPGDADSTGAHRNFGGPGDNLMQQPPNVPAKPVRSVKEAILALEAELAEEYESIKKVTK